MGPTSEGRKDKGKEGEVRKGRERPHDANSRIRPCSGWSIQHLPPPIAAYVADQWKSSVLQVLWASGEGGGESERRLGRLDNAALDAFRLAIKILKTIQYMLP